MKRQTGITPKNAFRIYAKQFWASDAVGKPLGIEILSINPGAAKLAMNVTRRMINSHKICHGAYIFALADSAFAVACNTYKVRSVGQFCSIAYVNRGELGDRLVAEAREIDRKARSGICDVTVKNDRGLAIALFRGHSRVFTQDSDDLARRGLLS